MFASLPFEFEHKLLERYWIRLRQIYEQEMDRRWYQDKAREGALRDSLLSAFMSFPDQVGEFLALLCYYNFPNIDLFFLERFTHNRGSNDAHRQEMVPYMMRFIHQKAADEVRMQEKTEEAARQVEAEKMRREAQAAEAG